MHDEVREISIETENEAVINIYITENEIETNLDTYEEVIYECSNDTPTDMMEDCVNKNLDDTNKNYFNEVSEIGVDYEEGEETKDIENEGIIHRYMNENEK